VLANYLREECNAQVTGFSGAKYKKFKDRAEAEQYIKANRVGYGAIGKLPNPSSPLQTGQTT